MPSHLNHPPNILSVVVQRITSGVITELRFRDEDAKNWDFKIPREVLLKQRVRLFSS